MTLAQYSHRAMRRAGALLSLFAVSCHDHPPAPPNATSGARKPNVLLVTIDTLRADHLPIYGYQHVKTPGLEQLAAQAVVFDHAQSHAPITLPSHASILTGLYPPRHGARSNGAYELPKEITTLAEYLRDDGYQTAAFVSAFVLDSRFGLDAGFDVYDDDMIDDRGKWSKLAVKDRRAELTVQSAMEWLARKRDAPFFAWVHVYDPHFSYEAPEPFASTYASGYDAEIAYVDAHLGRLFHELRRGAVLDDTMVVVTADHGESLGEHDEITHGVFVYDATQWVPLIIRLPKGERAGTRVAEQVRHIDIVPTIMEVVGPTPTQSMDGISLLPRMRDPNLKLDLPSYAEAHLPLEEYGWAAPRALRQGGYKVIDLPRAELYDLARDARETTNLIATNIARAESMRQALRALARDLETKAPRARHDPDADSLAALAALGYVADTPQHERARGEGRDPKDMLPVLNMKHEAQHLAEGGDLKGAVALAEKAARLDPQNAGLYANLGAYHAELGDYSAAESAYRRALSISPRRMGVHAGLANVYLKGKRDFAAATRELEAEVLVSPSDPSLWGLRGEILHEQGQYDEAIRAFEKGRVAGDQTPSFMVSHASALTRVGRLPEALEVITRALRAEPHGGMAHYNRAVILDQLGRPEEAEEAFRRAIASSYVTRDVYTGLASVMTARGRSTQLQTYLEERLAQHPTDAEAAYRLGTYLVAQRQIEAAARWLSVAAAALPQDPAPKTNLGVALLQLGRADEAIAQFSAAAGVMPPRSQGRAQALLRVAALELGRGRRSAARRAVSEATEHGGDAVRAIVQGDATLRALLP